MNILSLPDELLAAVLKKTDYATLVKMQLLNKRFNDVIKSFRIDRLQFNIMWIKPVNESHIMAGGRVTDDRLSKDTVRTWEYNLKYFPRGVCTSLDQSAILDSSLCKSSSVEQLELHSLTFDEDCSRIIVGHKGNFGFAVRGLRCLKFVACLMELPPIEFKNMLISSKIEKLYFDSRCKNVENIICNEILFTNPMELEIKFRYRLNDEDDFNLTGLTDDYIDFALENQKAAMYIEFVSTGFTVTKVLQVIEILNRRNDTRTWNFGTVKSDGHSLDEILNELQMLEAVRNQKCVLRAATIRGVRNICFIKVFKLREAVAGVDPDEDDDDLDEFELGMDRFDPDLEAFIANPHGGRFRRVQDEVVEQEERPLPNGVEIRLEEAGRTRNVIGPLMVEFGLEVEHFDAGLFPHNIPHHFVHHAVF